MKTDFQKNTTNRKKFLTGFTHTLNLVSNKFSILFFNIIFNKLNKIFYKKYTGKTKRKLVCGFTIVELIVTTGIFALITSIILVRDAQFNNTIRLSNLTYEVALVVRQAQIFGTGVREYGSGDFNVGYGVHFDTANNKSFIFFADANKNNIYDGTPEIIEIINIRGNNFISKFCVFSLKGNETCSDSGSKLDILFKRPSHNAIISSDIILGLNESARIYISSTTGDEKSVLVKFVGQISVE
ncbi:hypothetical protein KJ991_00285 [Patescibacteria group bacterium]|nr:hypothetical protein [Patescibacteria group bacterium]MBU4115703.1 hypothetical protein [Patescibacteria group bacterium]